jgi:hypothetical protein
VTGASPEAEAQRQALLGRVGEIEDVLTPEFGAERYARRLQAARSATDVLKTAIDALYLGNTVDETSRKALGVKAAAETAGEPLEDANVAPRGDYEPELGPDLPDYADSARMVPTVAGMRDQPQDAPDNLPTDPKARQGDQTTGTGGSGGGKVDGK